METTEIAARAPTRKRVCIIGNSYIGALKKAYSTGFSDAKRLEFSFFASAGRSFHEIDIRNGILSNIHYGDDASRSIRDYDIAVIYGDMPTPDQLFGFAQRARESLYSEGLRQARLRDWLMSFKSYSICTSLVAIKDKNVFLLSRNIRSDEFIASQTAYDAGLNIIRELIKPAIYIPMPATLFSDDGRPQEKYYTGSLNVIGIEPNREEQPMHHSDHFNEAGGRLVLKAVLDTFAKHVAS